MRFAIFALTLATLMCRAAEPLIPTADGTTWNYNLVQEKPIDSLDLTEPKEEARAAVQYRMHGLQKIDNKDLLRFEMLQDNVLTGTNLIAVDEGGISCAARIDEKGAAEKFDPVQMMVATPLKIGAKWSFDGKIGQTTVSQRYEIADQEDVDVPAGKFRAWRIHCEQTLPTTAIIDRWFVPGTGFVKVQTAVKAPSGGILQKTSLTLKESPKIESARDKDVTIQIRSLSAGVADKPNGAFKTEFKSDTPAIYVRWRGHALRDKTQIRAVFVAESLVNISADQQLDESSASAPSPNSSGTFTLAKPGRGWALGDYRVELFLDGELVQTVEFKISR